MSNSQMGNNEYTTVEQRKKQQLSRQPVTQEPVGAAGGSGGGTVAAAAVTNPTDEYTSFLREIKAQQDKQVQAAFKQGKENLDAAKAAANKDAYVTYMHGLKNMPQMSAVSGNGGYAQSLATKQQLNYENNRNAVAQDYLNKLMQLQTNRDNGIISNNSDYLTQLAALKKDAAATAGTAAAGGATLPTAYKYKLGGNTYTDQEFITYLKGLGMTQAEIARYMQANGLTL